MSAEALVRGDPELRRLDDLVDAGWRFEHLFGDAGHVRQINGSRATGRYIDGIRVRDRTDVAGIRWDRGDARVLWNRDGRLADVVDALLTLPEPS